MKLRNYIKDKWYEITIFIIFLLIILLLLFAFKIDRSLIIVIISLFIFFYITIFFINYFRKKTFYNKLLINIERLDKAYLVLETIEIPNFYEGKLLCQALYAINKSMIENINSCKNQMEEFKEYIEMWIHEVKIPISSLILMAHNYKNRFDKTSIEQMKKIENYVEQVLYYVRSENSEKDYLIKKVALKKVVCDIALKNQQDLLENKIDLIVENVEKDIYTDSKWLEFILNQIINNSIKYRKNTTNSYIKITTKDSKEKICLIIEDNGIGIPKEDINKVFLKSFTGHNGRIKTKSTGIGLFIAKNLCKKLGHKIEIDSVQDEYTKVFITFYKNKYYEVVK